MKFVCDQCQTKYAIDDKRVRGKVLKIRCKACQNLITVRDPSLPASAGPRVEGEARAPVRKTVDLDEADLPSATEHTQVSAAPGAMAAIMAAVQPVSSAKPAAAKARGKGRSTAGALPIKDWFVSFDGVQEGPHTLEVARERVRSEVAAGKEAFAWKDGFAAWLPVEEVPDLAPPAAAPPASPPPPPPPPATRAEPPPTEPARAVVAKADPLVAEPEPATVVPPEGVDPAPARAEARFVAPLLALDSGSSTVMGQPVPLFAREPEPAVPPSAEAVDEKPAPTVAEPTTAPSRPALFDELADLLAEPQPRAASRALLDAGKALPEESTTIALVEPKRAPAVEPVAPEPPSAPAAGEAPTSRGGPLPAEAALPVAAAVIDPAPLFAPPAESGPAKANGVSGRAHSLDELDHSLSLAASSTAAPSPVVVIEAPRGRGMLYALVAAIVVIVLLGGALGYQMLFANRPPTVVTASVAQPASAARTPAFDDRPIGIVDNAAQAASSAQLPDAGAGRNAAPSGGSGQSGNAGTRKKPSKPAGLSPGLSEEQKRLAAMYSDPGKASAEGLPRVQLEERKGGGEQVSDAAIAGAVMRNKKLLQPCFERALKADPGMRNQRIDVQIKVGVSGGVTQVSFGDSRLASAELGTCLKGTIKRWHFPSQDSEYETAFPLLLQSQ